MQTVILIWFCFFLNKKYLLSFNLHRATEHHKDICMVVSTSSTSTRVQWRRSPLAPNPFVLLFKFWRSVLGISGLLGAHVLQQGNKSRTHRGHVLICHLTSSPPAVSTVSSQSHLETNSRTLCSISQAFML